MFTLRRREKQKQSCPAVFSFLLFTAASLGGGCGIPIVPFTLAPVPHAGAGDHPIKAQIRRAAVTMDLLGAGAQPGTGSRLAIEIDLYNADAQRVFDLGVPEVRTQGALGGPIAKAGVVTIQALGLPPKVSPWPSRPDDQLRAWVVRLAPGQGQTFSIAYDQLSPCDAGGPLRILVTIPVSGQPPLEMVLAAPVENGPRWRTDSAPVALVWGGSWTSLSGSGGSLLEPIGYGVVYSKGRLVWGFNLRFGVLYRDTLASGPPAWTETLALNLGWHPGHFPVGVYATGGLTFGVGSAPRAYQRTGDGSADSLLLPRVSAGIVLNAGAPLPGPTLLPVERPRSAMRRFAIRVGYTRLFNTQDRHGTPGFELAFDTALMP